MRTFDFAEAVRGRIARDVVISCKAGCAWCCNAKIVMDAGSGAMIALYLMSEKRWTPALVAKLEAADRAMAPTSHADWLARQEPCALLRVEGPGRGRCSVYPVRPVGCSGTYSNAADPRDCATPGGRSLIQLDLKAGDLAPLMVDHEALLNGLGESVMWLMTLPGAVLYGAALVEKRLPPPVFKISKEAWNKAHALGGPSIQDFFDLQAARRNL